MMEIRVHADQWRDHSWLESLPGHPDYDHKRAGLDQLQRAILAISTEIADEVLYRSTGWRETPEGRHEFIHRRGAITAEGHRSIEVAFSGPIQRYDLPDPVRDPGSSDRPGWMAPPPCSTGFLIGLLRRCWGRSIDRFWVTTNGSSPWWGRRAPTRHLSPPS